MLLGSVNMKQVKENALLWGNTQLYAQAQTNSYGQGGRPLMQPLGAGHYARFAQERQTHQESAATASTSHPGPCSAARSLEPIPPPLHTGAQVILENLEQIMFPGVAFYFPKVRMTPASFMLSLQCVHETQSASMKAFCLFILCTPNPSPSRSNTGASVSV